MMRAGQDPARAAGGLAERLLNEPVMRNANFEKGFTGMPGARAISFLS